MLRVPAWTVVFVLAGYAGRATIIDGNALSLVWPAAGVAVLWLCTATSRVEQVIDMLAIGACTFLVNVTTGAPARLAAVFVVANLIQLLTFNLVMRRSAPHLWGFGGQETLARLRDLGFVVISATTACLAAASSGSLLMYAVTGNGSLSTFLVWWGRNTTGLLIITAFGLLLLGPIATRHGTIRASLAGSLAPRSTRHATEAVILSLGTALMLYGVFVGGTAQPLAFLLLFASVVAGVRLGPVGAAVHGLVSGSVAIMLTIQGYGPFAAVADVDDRALYAQVFVTMTVVTGLLLAFSRAERDRANATLGRLNQRLRASERESADRAALFQAVLDQMHEGVAVVQADGVVLVRNPAGRELMGLEGPPAAAIEETDVYGLTHRDGRPILPAELPFARAMAGEQLRAEDFSVRTPDNPDGRILEMDASKLPRLEPDDPERVLISFRDVTAERLERDNLASFAGVVAHDLINPLAAVKGWSHVLKDGLADGDLDEGEGLSMVERIESASDMMSSFIGDLLSYTVSRDTRLTITPIDLSAIARDVAEMRSHGERLPNVSVQDGLFAEGDAMLVRQLLDNLVGNAVKYVAPQVVPVVRVSGEVRDGMLEVVVADNGIGVPEDMRQRIFENFQRAHTEGYKGTGIGLAICRRVVKRHGGSISMRPAGVDGFNGSSFVFTLPLAAADLDVQVPVEASIRV